jgi:hypothetical protein
MLGFLPDAPRNKLYVDPLLPGWLPDITIRDLRLGRHKFDIRFWREGEQTEFEVLDGRSRQTAPHPAAPAGQALQ